MMTEEYRKEARNCSNPYEGNETSEKILRIIQKTLRKGIEYRKKFYDLDLCK